MNDIENLEIDDTIIENKYSKNPYWNNQPIVNLNLDEWEKKENDKKEKDIFLVLKNTRNYFENKNYYIWCFLFFLISSIISLIGLIIAIMLNYYSLEICFNILTNIFFMFSIGFFIQIMLIDEKFIFRKTLLYKKFKNNFKKNNKIINKIIKNYKNKIKKEKTRKI